MNLKSFLSKINSLSEEILKKDSSHIYSHSMHGEILIEDDNGNIFKPSYFEIIQLPGCGCPCGIRIMIDKVD